MKILLIDGDEDRADVVRRGLAASGHVVDVESDPADGESLATAPGYDAIVLDEMVASALGAGGVHAPILMLEGLTKPFVFDDLEARLRSITRRDPALRRDTLVVGDLSMDLATRQVRRGNREIELSPRETAFLEFFMRNAGLLLTRKMLTDALWERDRETVSNVIDAYVRRLRRKLSEAGEQQLIATVRGVGYRLRQRPA